MDIHDTLLTRLGQTARHVLYDHEQGGGRRTTLDGVYLVTIKGGELIGVEETQDAVVDLTSDVATSKEVVQHYQAEIDQKKAGKGDAAGHPANSG